MDATHTKVTELLPWYVNGTLSDHQRAEIDRHLGECLTCRAALQEEQRIHGLVRDQEDIPVGPAYGISDLLSRIDGKSANSRPILKSPVYAFSVAVAGIAAVVAFVFFMQPIAPDPGSASFKTLTDAPLSATNRIDIIFADELESAEISTIINAINGRIIDGPSELGRHTVALPEGSESAVQAAIEMLQRDTRVQFVGRNFIAGPQPEDQ